MRSRSGSGAGQGPAGDRGLFWRCSDMNEAAQCSIRWYSVAAADPAVAAVAAEPAQAVPVADRRPLAVPGNRSCAPAGSRTRRPPVTVCSEDHRFMVGEQLQGDRGRQRRHPARAGGAQHRAGDRAGGAARAGWRCRGHDAGDAGRPPDRGRGRVPRGRRQRPRPRRWTTGWSHSASAPTTPKPATATSCVASAAGGRARRRRLPDRALRREARPGHRRALPGRGHVCLEFGHVPVQGASATSTNWRGTRPAILAAAQAAYDAARPTSISSASTRTRSPPAPAIRSTTR